MVNTKDARAWARGALRGIGDSLYTPFRGEGGDEIDWDAYRLLVRYCVGELGHKMLWCTSGIAEFWSLTLQERKRLLEVAIEGRAANPDVVVQACTAAISAKDCPELTCTPSTQALTSSNSKHPYEGVVPDDRTTSLTGEARSSSQPQCWASRRHLSAFAPAQAQLPAEARSQIQEAYSRLGFVAG